MKKVKNLIFGIVVGIMTFWGMSLAEASSGTVCRGIKLNTDVPFVWRCIGTTVSDETTQLNAFPKLMWAMMKLIMTVILVISLLMIVAAGVMMTTGGYEKGNYSKGLEMIKKVAIGIALLGASWVILKLINPNFFV